MARIAVSFWVIFLLVSIASGQDPHSRCPPPSEIEPCACRRSCIDCRPTITCSGIESREVLEHVIAKSGDYPFMTFAVLNAGFDSVPVAMLEQKRVEFLTVANSSLVSVFDALPLESSVLGSLHLHNLELQRGVRWELLYQLYALTELVISRVDVPNIDDSFGKIMPKQMRVLHLSRTMTTELGKNALAPLRNLKAIVLRNSQIKSIERTMFPRPYRGTIMDFSYNKIQQLPEDIFLDMPSLKSVLLNSNNLARLPEEVFTNVGKTISFIPIRDNPIRCDCRMKWITTRVRMPYVDAQCFSPDELEGRKLRELREEDFAHC